MAHFAEIENNHVVQVLVIDNEFEDRGEDYLANELGLGGQWVQTSYNGNFRNKYAGIGDYYDEATDAFYASAPFPSWTFQPEADGSWIAPEPKPTDGEYTWDEATLTWVQKVSE